MGADFSRDCRKCVYCKKEANWTLKKAAYRCMCPNHKRSGWIIGIGRPLPYVPAWCPKKRCDEA